MRLVDTSAWIEWLIGSPIGTAPAAGLPGRVGSMDVARSHSNQKSAMVACHPRRTMTPRRPAGSRPGDAIAVVDATAKTGKTGPAGSVESGGGSGLPEADLGYIAGTRGGEGGGAAFEAARGIGEGKSGMSRWLGLGVLLGAGLASIAWAQSPAGFDGQYMGELALTKIIKGDCATPPPGALYPLTISRGEVRFAYVPRFDTALRGRVGENGGFKASARARKGFVQMTGHIQGNSVTAHIASPSCNYTFQTRN